MINHNIVEHEQNFFLMYAPFDNGGMKDVFSCSLYLLVYTVCKTVELFSNWYSNTIFTALFLRCLLYEWYKFLYRVGAFFVQNAFITLKAAKKVYAFINTRYSVGQVFFLKLHYVEQSSLFPLTCACVIFWFLSMNATAVKWKGRHRRVCVSHGPAVQFNFHD